MIELGRFGVWASMNGMTAAPAAGFAQRVEAGGYGKPVEAMRAPMEALRRAGYAAPSPPEPPRTATAALGPNA